MFFKIISSCKPRYESATLRIIGITMFFVSMMMLPSICFAVYNNEALIPFVLPFAAGTTASSILMYLFGLPKRISPAGYLVMICAVWFTCIGFGLIPFLFSGLSLVDAIFESTSGFTTTGATILADIESWPTSMLLWRSVTNGIGGIVTVVIFMLLLPKASTRNRSLFSNELSGSEEQDFFPDMSSAAKKFAVTYVVMILVMILILIMLGTNLYDSLCIALSAISTGGFMNANDSLASFDIWVKTVTTIFMFLGATNFYLHYKRFYSRQKNVYLGNEEFRLMLVWFLFVIVATFLFVFGGRLSEIDIPQEFVNVALNIVSAGTNTGFAASDFALWPSAALFFILLIALVGGSTGSTAGGIKIYRILVIVKSIRYIFTKTIHPHAVVDIRVDNASLDNDRIISVYGIAFLFLFTVIVGTVLIMICGESATDSIALVISSITNFGPGFGDFGPMGSCQTLEPAAKLILSGIMWMGRLEVLAALALVMPSFWRELRLDRRHRKKLGGQ